MRLLVVNPNTTAAVTGMLVDQARQAAEPGTEVCGITAEFGVSAIESRAEAQVAGHAVIRGLISAGHADAAIVGAFADPGLAAARELMTCPVVGIGEASMLTACLLGSRFAVVTAGSGTAPAIEAQAHDYGLGARFAGVRGIDGSLLAIAGDQAAFDDAIVSVSDDVVRVDGAEVIILGGAVFAGMAVRIGHRVSVPVLDPVRCAVMQATTLVRVQS